MLSLYRTLSVRYLQQRWLRALLVVASIALGVATLVATRTLNHSMWSATRTAVTPLASADLFIANGDTGVAHRLADEVRQAPGVRDVQPIVVGRVRLPDIDEQPHAQVLGVVWRPDVGDHNPWGVKVEWIIPPDSIPGLMRADTQSVLGILRKSRTPQPVLVGKELARKLKPAPVESWLEPILNGLKKAIAAVSKDFAHRLDEIVPVRIQSVGKSPDTFLKVGYVEAEGAVGAVVNHSVFMNAADAARLMDLGDLVTRIDVFLEPTADRDAVRQELQELLGQRATVQTPGENEQRVQKLMAGLQMGFSLSGAGALVIGLFLVYMILSVTVADRRHEIGVLRALGATRGQVWGLFVGEAALLGLAGAAIGVPFGIYLADVLGLEPIRALLSDLIIPLDKPYLEVTPETITAAAVAGIVTALLAALLPAVHAAREEPASAVRRAPVRQGMSHWIHLGVASASFLVVGTACMMMRSHLPERLGTYGGFVLVLIGTLLTTPLLAAVAARMLQPVARAVLGIEGRLAADNLVRTPGRTGLVITVLAAGVALFMQTAGVIRSNRDPIMEWVSEMMDADLIVNSGHSTTGTGQSLALPDYLGRTAVETFPEIQAALPMRYRQVDFRNTPVFLLSLDAEGFAAANRRLGTGTSRDLYPLLRQVDANNALVSQNFAALHHVQSGDTVRIRGPRGPIDLRVAGAVVDYNFPTGTIIVDRQLYLRHFDDPLVDEFYIYLRNRADTASLKEKLRQHWEPQHAIKVATRAELLARYERMIQRFADVAYAQEVVVGLVAALGVLFAVLISVIQRRRELGVLRAVGATQGQVLRSVMGEAVLMGFIGTAIGLLVGVPVQWYCVQVIMFEEAGFVLPVRIPWQEAAVIGAASMLTATLAGVWPAIRTSRLRIPEAIAYE
jgi:putative ABC transport system permease protein